MFLFVQVPREECIDVPKEACQQVKENFKNIIIFQSIFPMKLAT